MESKESILKNMGLGPWMKTFPLIAAQVKEAMDIYAGEFQPSPSTPLPETGGEEVPKMSEELAAESDMAAIGYGQMSDRPEPFELSDISDAFEAGQSWMWKKIGQQLSSSTLRIEELEKEVLGWEYDNKQQRTKVSALEAQLSASQQEAAEYRNFLWQLIPFLENRDYLAYAEDISGLIARYPQPSTNTDK